MILLTAGQSTTLTAGIKGQIYFLTINGGSSATVSGAVTDSLGPSQNTKSYGPFDIGQSIVVTCAQGEVRIETGDSNPVTNDGAATLSDVVKLKAQPDGSPYTVIVDYFPGWSTPGGGPNPAAPWAIIPLDRIPFNGAYDETNQAVVDEQLKMMRDYGVDVVAVYWFFDTITHSNASEELVPALEHWINAYMASKVINKPKFCIHLANATNSSYFTVNGWDNMIWYWITKYFSNINYYKVDEKPVVFLHGVDVTHSNMTGGINAGIKRAKSAAISAGYPGLYWVNGISNMSSFWLYQCGQWGGDALYTNSVYYKWKTDGSATSGGVFTSFQELEDRLISAPVGGAVSWVPTWLDNTYTLNKNIIMPLSAGFSDQPWNNASSKFANPSPAQFNQHCINVRNLVDANYERTRGQILITAWNEFGEGSILEPCKQIGGTARLEIIRDVFKRAQQVGISGSIFGNLRQITGSELNIAAAGNPAATQATSKKLFYRNNQVVTVVSGDGVLLQVIGDGDEQTIFNASANALLVYPPTGMKINALAVNASFSLPSGKTCAFKYLGSNQYITLLAA